MVRRSAHRGRCGLSLGLGAALLSATAACSSTASGAPSATPPPTAPGASSTDVTPRDDLRDEHVVGWTRSELVGDRGVRVFFSIGNLHCYGARASVASTRSAVVITVHEGLVPGAPDVCSAEALQASLLITTDSPVAGRSVRPS